MARRRQRRRVKRFKIFGLTPIRLVGRILISLFFIALIGLTIGSTTEFGPGKVLFWSGLGLVILISLVFLIPGKLGRKFRRDLLGQ